MGYQALLFCPDEKLARVVTQVFSELDFNVELVNEPFGAVKKLMTQRYDALAVDCENEQNATLLFKSARNSQTNQNSLALALVEGQAGVAKAYRIGANLLLTKPINVEQAKGTLRVARGLLRKTADGTGTSAKTTASTAAPIKPAPGTPMTFPDLEKHNAQPVLPAKLAFAMPEFESSLPAMAASGKVADEIPVAPPAPDIQAGVSTEVNPPAKVQLPAATLEVSEPPAATTVPLPAKQPIANFTNMRGAAAAPAPARDVPAPAEKRAVKAKPIETISSPAGFTENTAVPTFSALGDHEASEGSGGAKKFLGIAAVLAVAAVLGYFGWTKFGQSAWALHSQGVVQKPASALPAASVAPSPAVPFISTSGMPAATSQPAVVPGSQPAKPSASVGNLPTIRIAANPEPVTKKPETAPIRVKSETAMAKAKTQAEESAVQVPSPLGVASANDETLSGLVSSAPASLPRAVPGTLRISQGVSQGLLIRRVQPTYPSTALAMRMQGVVQLEAIINKEGMITNLKTVSGDPVLARAAAGAVKQWRYKPYYLDGEPVEIQTQITVNFKLPN
jgi:protein TonB